MDQKYIIFVNNNLKVNLQFFQNAQRTCFRNVYLKLFLHYGFIRIIRSRSIELYHFHPKIWGIDFSISTLYCFKDSFVKKHVLGLKDIGTKSIFNLIGRMCNVISRQNIHLRQKLLLLKDFLSYTIMKLQLFTSPVEFLILSWRLYEARTLDYFLIKANMMSIYLHLDHVCSLGTHLTHKIENIHCFVFFDHIQHCKYSNECASSAYTSAKIEQKGNISTVTKNNNTNTKPLIFISFCILVFHLGILQLI